MLKRVEIKQFRSCHDVVLDGLEPVTVLAGRNAVGKTNILRAIEWLTSVATAAALPRVEGWHVLLDAVVEQTIYHYSLSVQRRVLHHKRADRSALRISLIETLMSEDTNGVRTVVFDRDNEHVGISQTGSEITIGATAPCMPALVSLLPADHPVVGLISPFLLFLGRVRYYPLLDSPELDNFHGIRQTTYDEWLAQYRSTGDPGDSVGMRLLHAAQTDRKQFDELKGLLGPDGLGLLDDILIRSVSMPTKSEDRKEPKEKETEMLYWVHFQPCHQSPNHPSYFGFENLSAGTQRVIRILVSLIFDQSAVMLLEHPEDGIHRGLLRKLIDVLQKYADRSQLIVSSHSSIVFDTLDPGTVRLVTMGDGNTKVRSLTPNELRAAGRFLEEEGSLSDFLETVEED